MENNGKSRLGGCLNEIEKLENYSGSFLQPRRMTRRRVLPEERNKTISLQLNLSFPINPSSFFSSALRNLHIINVLRR